MFASYLCVEIWLSHANEWDFFFFKPNPNQLTSRCLRDTSMQLSLSPQCLCITSLPVQPLTSSPVHLLQRCATNFENLWPKVRQSLSLLEQLIFFFTLNAVNLYSSSSNLQSSFMCIICALFYVLMFYFLTFCDIFVSARIQLFR